MGNGPQTRHVALVGCDYLGLKLTMEVREGDQAHAGQLGFTDKKTDGIRYTARGSDGVATINCGAKRVIESLVIELDDGNG